MIRVISRCLRLFALCAAVRGAEPPPVGTPPAVAPSLESWRADRFGMFIHWGPVSLKGTEIGWSRGAQVLIAEYDSLYQQFNPTNFDANAWAKLAKDSGMKYVVFTTKHHDGFCMWDTRQTDHNIMRSPFGRDVVKELAAACRRQGLAFGTYYSVCDWHHPDFPRTSPGGRVRREQYDLDRYEQYLRAQISELLTQYGPLCVLWFDVPQEFDARRGQGVIDFARTLQPSLLVNNRSGAPGDYDTPEQRIGKSQSDRPWETCMTLCEQWAWKPNDSMKSLAQCLRSLVLCAGGDGNLLFNVGPMPDGRIEPRQVERLRDMGGWLARFGSTIYGTRGGPWKPTQSVASTRTGNSIFVHLLRPGAREIALPNIPRKIVRSTLLTGGRAWFRQHRDQILIRLSPPLPERGAQLLLPEASWAQTPPQIDSIVRLDLDGSAMDLPLLSVSSQIKATASNVYQQDEAFGPDKAFDDDPGTRWATDAGTHQAWLALDLGRPERVNGVRIHEAYAGRVRQFEFQRKAGEGWQTIFTGTTLGNQFYRNFPTVTASELRLNILEATEGPTLTEIEILHPN